MKCLTDETRGVFNSLHFVQQEPLFSAFLMGQFWWGFIQLINSPLKTAQHFQSIDAIETPHQLEV